MCGIVFPVEVQSYQNQGSELDFQILNDPRISVHLHWF
jgi:hypothetical protein